MFSRLIVAAVLALLLVPSIAGAQIRGQVVASGLSSPIAFVPDPAVAGVSYIVQQGGLVRVLRDGALLPTPFADLRALISTGGERGLLGMAFPPNAATTGRVFFNYTDTNGHTVIARYLRTAANPLAIVPGTRFDLLWPTGERFIRQPYSNHNGGNLAFGPDGYLYVGLGDGGSGNDPENRAQNPSELLGKMLRIDVSVADNDAAGYRVPPDNPFLDGQPILARGEIWSFGLRNPWRYSFDDFGAGATGALFLGDVGQSAREEINAEPAGAGGRNYGWRIREGFIATPGISPSEQPAYLPLTDPIYDLDRTRARSITGGYVYRGAALGAAYRGRYFFADFVLSRVYSLGLSVNTAGEFVVTDVAEHTAELGGATALGGVASFGRDLQGELYVVTFAGNVLQILLDTTTPPNPPSNIRFVVSGSTVTLQFSPPIGGAWPTDYRLDAGTAPGATNIGSVFVPASQLLMTFVGVPPGTYFARLYSHVSLRASAPSPEQTVTVTGTCSAVPPAPLSFSHSIAGRFVTLAWDMASTTNGPLTFEIEAGSATGLRDLAVLVIDGSTRAFSVTAPPGRYFVRIRGRNACGLGAVSSEIIVAVQ
jgi:glucose/arabinose dehydrogenase